MSKKTQQNKYKGIIDQIVQIANTVVVEQERVEAMIRATLSIVPLSEGPMRPIRVLNVDGFTFALFDQTVSSYDALLERLLQKEEWIEKYSEEYLDKQLQHLFMNILQGRQIVQSQVEQLFIQLVTDFDSYSCEHVVYVPISGLTLEADTFQMGNVVFRKGTDAFFNDLSNRVDAIFLLTLNTDQEQVVHTQMTKRRIELMKGLVCAEFSVVAEPQRAKERAEEEIHLILDLLRYSIAVHYSRGLRIAVGLQGEVHTVIRTTVVFAKDEQSVELLSSQEGPLCPLHINSEAIMQMEQIGILKMARLLEQPTKQTDFERTILRSIHWFASSRMQVERENELLNLMTSLETLFAPPDGRSVTAAVAEGVARILTAEVEGRKAIVKKINDLYGMRSGISHGGKKVVLERDIGELRAIVKEVIFLMIERKEEFSSQKELANWLIERRLMG